MTERGAPTTATLTTAQKLRQAATQWEVAHAAIHGPLSIEESQLAHEVWDFAITCAQAWDGQHGGIRE